MDLMWHTKTTYSHAKHTHSPNECNILPPRGYSRAATIQCRKHGAHKVYNGQKRDAGGLEKEEEENLHKLSEKKNK